MNIEENMSLPRISSFFHFFFIVISVLFITVTESKCKKGCDLALASYYAWENTNLTFISEVLHSKLVPKGVADSILEIKKWLTKTVLKLLAESNVPFPCDGINNEFLGHVFKYEVKSGDTYDKMAGLFCSILTMVEWLQGLICMKKGQ